MSPSACSRSISTEIAPALMFPSTLTFNARSPTSPTSPVAAMVPAEPVSSICWSVATPDAMAIVEICFWASSRALNVSASSGNFTVPLSAARSARVAERSASSVTMPPSAADAPGIADGLSPLTAAFSVDGPPMRGISTGSGGTTSRGMRPEASNDAAPQLPVRVSTRASPSATVAFNWMFEKPGSSRGDRISPFSTVTTRSGLIALSVPVSVPVSVTAPSPATGVSAGRYCVSVARLPCRSTVELTFTRAIGERQFTRHRQHRAAGLDLEAFDREPLLRVLQRRGALHAEGLPVPRAGKRVDRGLRHPLRGLDQIARRLDRRAQLTLIAPVLGQTGQCRDVEVLRAHRHLRRPWPGQRDERIRIEVVTLGGRLDCRFLVLGDGIDTR